MIMHISIQETRKDEKTPTMQSMYSPRESNISRQHICKVLYLTETLLWSWSGTLLYNSIRNQPLKIRHSSQKSAANRVKNDFFLQLLHIYYMYYIFERWLEEPCPRNEAVGYLSKWMCPCQVSVHKNTFELLQDYMARGGALFNTNFSIWCNSNIFWQRQSHRALFLAPKELL